MGQRKAWQEDERHPGLVSLTGTDFRDLKSSQGPARTARSAKAWIGTFFFGKEAGTLTRRLLPTTQASTQHERGRGRPAAAESPAAAAVVAAAVAAATAIVAALAIAPAACPRAAIDARTAMASFALAGARSVSAPPQPPQPSYSDGRPLPQPSPPLLPPPRQRSSPPSPTQPSVGACRRASWAPFRLEQKFGYFPGKFSYML